MVYPKVIPESSTGSCNFNPVLYVFRGGCTHALHRKHICRIFDMGRMESSGLTAALRLQVKDEWVL